MNLRRTIQVDDCIIITELSIPLPSSIDSWDPADVAAAINAYTPDLEDFRTATHVHFHFPLQKLPASSLHDVAKKINATFAKDMRKGGYFISAHAYPEKHCVSVAFGREYLREGWGGRARVV